MAGQTWAGVAAEAVARAETVVAADVCFGAGVCAACSKAKNEACRASHLIPPAVILPVPGNAGFG